MVTTEINHMRSLLKGKAEMIIYFWSVLSGFNSICFRVHMVG